MLIPKANRAKIYDALFQEGVMVAKKDFNAPKHMILEDVPNLQVIKALQSLTSRGYTKVQFNWQYYFWVLTDEGINYLRDYLHLPADVVPNTMKKKAIAVPRAGPREERPRREGGDRDGYRPRRYEGAPGARPDFRGGFGRGSRVGAPAGQPTEA